MILMGKTLIWMGKTLIEIEYNFDLGGRGGQRQEKQGCQLASTGEILFVDINYLGEYFYYMQNTFCWHWQFGWMLFCIFLLFFATDKILLLQVKYFSQVDIDYFLTIFGWKVKVDIDYIGWILFCIFTLFCKYYRVK